MRRKLNIEALFDTVETGNQIAGKRKYFAVFQGEKFYTLKSFAKYITNSFAIDTARQILHNDFVGTSPDLTIALADNSTAILLTIKTNI